MGQVARVIEMTLGLKRLFQLWLVWQESFISHNNVVAELYNNLGNYVTLYDGIRFVGEIGSYVAIDDINRRIIAEIIAVDEKSDMVSEKLNKAESHRYLRINLIGEICNGISA